MFEVQINMTVADLKGILTDLPDDMSIIIPVINEDDCNDIIAFRHVRTAGILFCEYEEKNEQRVLCLNAAEHGVDISTQIKSRNSDISCEKVMF